jgi:hypothetical protein
LIYLARKKIQAEGFQELADARFAEHMVQGIVEACGRPRKRGTLLPVGRVRESAR